MSGWGSYTPDDGCFQRVRYTGVRSALPVGFRAHDNGVLIRFSEPIDAAIAVSFKNHFAQCWNYRYGPGYGSPEFSPRHPSAPGHDPLLIASAHVVEGGRALFLELPDIQPVNQLHLRLKVDLGAPQDIFATIHKLAPSYTEFPGYVMPGTPKVVAAHPIELDLALAAARVPNPWREPLPGARGVRIEAGKNLSFSTSVLNAEAGEAIALEFHNPDVVPHNWALIEAGTLQKVGDLANKLIAQPDAVARHYIPESDDVLAYTDIVEPGQKFTIYFRAPEKPGRYPFLCTFPGHWVIMNGVLVVK
jgi:azurin